MDVEKEIDVLKRKVFDLEFDKVKTDKENLKDPSIDDDIREWLLQLREEKPHAPCGLGAYTYNDNREKIYYSEIKTSFFDSREDAWRAYKDIFDSALKFRAGKIYWRQYPSMIERDDFYMCYSRLYIDK